MDDQEHEGCRSRTELGFDTEAGLAAAIECGSWKGRWIIQHSQLSRVATAGESQTERYHSRQTTRIIQAFIQ